MAGRPGRWRLNRDVLKLVTAVIGNIELRKLTAHDVTAPWCTVRRLLPAGPWTLAHNALPRARATPKPTVTSPITSRRW